MKESYYAYVLDSNDHYRVEAVSGADAVSRLSEVLNIRPERIYLVSKDEAEGAQVRIRELV